MKKAVSSKKALSFSSALERSDNKLWGAHVRVPGAIAKQLIDPRSRRVVCSLNDSTPFQCAILHFGRGGFVVSVNKSLRTALSLTFGTKVRVSLTKDSSEYGLPFPEELKELLRQDTQGKRLFLALTQGKQRTLLYMVSSAKAPDKRIARALTIVNHLKSNQGKINYRQLYTSFKTHRQPS